MTYGWDTVTHGHYTIISSDLVGRKWPQGMYINNILNTLESWWTLGSFVSFARSCTASFHKTLTKQRSKLQVPTHLKYRSAPSQFVQHQRQKKLWLHRSVHFQNFGSLQSFQRFQSFLWARFRQLWAQSDHRMSSSWCMSHFLLSFRRWAWQQRRPG